MSAKQLRQALVNPTHFLVADGTAVADNVGYSGIDEVLASKLGSAAYEDLATTQDFTTVGWKDMLAPLSAAGVPPSSAPTMTNFVVGTISRREYAFSVGDLLYVQPFHVNHDISPGSKAYIHIHWTTNGTNTQPVRWEFEIARALGHNQASFTQVTTVQVTQDASGVPYRHMIAEVSDEDALTLVEPDELILVTVRRVTNGGTNNTDTVFGLMCDLHYQATRHSTLNKSPDFFA
jgi:hypothetical protein